MKQVLNICLCFGVAFLLNHFFSNREYQKPNTKPTPFGNQNSTQSDPQESTPVVDYETVTSYQFEEPFMLKAGGSPIKPAGSHSCPEWADIDGDGSPELIIGELKHGRIKAYQHTGGLEFSTGKPIQADGRDAFIYGVW